MNETLTVLSNFLELLAATIAAAGTVIAALTALVRPFRQWVIKKINYRNQVDAKIEEIEQTFGMKLASVDETLKSLHELVVQVKQENAENNASQNEDIKLIKAATLASTRNTLTYLSRKAREKGEVTSNDRENYDKMYQAYTALGGNSYVHRLYDEYMLMPVKE